MTNPIELPTVGETFVDISMIMPINTGKSTLFHTTKL